jgi:hypothetical protein
MGQSAICHYHRDARLCCTNSNNVGPKHLRVRKGSRFRIAHLCHYDSLFSLEQVKNLVIGDKHSVVIARPIDYKEQERGRV